MRYIHYLLSNPNAPVDVTTLRQLAKKQHRPDPNEPILESREKSSTTLDKRAIQEYHLRASELEAEIGHAHETGAYTRRDELKIELEQIERQRRAAGRPLDRTRKKAQEAIKKRIDEAGSRIEREIPRLASCLRKSIDTGYECVYTPDPDHTLAWVLTPPGGTPFGAGAARPT